MSVILSFLAILSMVIISLVYLKEPLSEKGYSNGWSLLIRLVIGIVLGCIVSLLINF